MVSNEVDKTQKFISRLDYKMRPLITAQYIKVYSEAVERGLILEAEAKDKDARREQWKQKRNEGSTSEGPSWKKNKGEDIEEDLRGCSWRLFVDGSSNQIGASIRVKLQTPEGTSLSQMLQLEFRATNNEAEYEALLTGLRLAKELKVRNLSVFSDSQLIVRQVSGEYKTKNETMEAYSSAIMQETKDFEKIEFTQIPREHNEDPDRLACSASSFGETLARVILVGILSQPSIFEEPSDSDS
ncbi:uncharacterized protein LOC132316710 [Cornus florida]|uniref:uncharacterized protein LOC132316710 n=1 Tax=Cornus florida TaxID=4283 RepID=UPI0028A10139|nr:uncharacterized protein LOC132316710 [Cornus florida]